MKISVALCTYNGEKFLKQQLESILNQKVKVDEIIVCDDVSTDSTLSILNHYQLV
ncbi:MAG: glycosyltransferase, partial [Kaistella sp.]|nr:glycosyltransferase [Kaistella sp.]